MENQNQNQNQNQRKSERYESSEHEYRRESLLDRIKRDVSSWFEGMNDHRDAHASQQSHHRHDESQSDDSPGDYGHGRYDMDDARLHFRGHLGTPQDDRYQRPSRNHVERGGRSHSRRSEPVGDDTRYGRERTRGDASAGDVRNQPGAGNIDRDGDGVYGDYGVTASRPPYHYTHTEYWIVPGPHSGTGPKGYQRSSESLKERICERLESHGGIDASDIDVSVENSEVTLTGTVPTREQKRLSEQCAESVRGIQDVHNRLSVRRNAQSDTASRRVQNRSDAGIRSRSGERANNETTPPTSGPVGKD